MRELALNEIEAVSGGFGEPHEDGGGGGVTGINAWAAFGQVSVSPLMAQAWAALSALSMREAWIRDYLPPSDQAGPDSVGLYASFALPIDMDEIVITRMRQIVAETGGDNPETEAVAIFQQGLQTVAGLMVLGGIWPNGALCVEGLPAPDGSSDKNPDYEHVADIGDATDLVYEQSTGDLYKVNPDGSLTLVARGYSGAEGWGRNNPAAQYEQNVGPIPVGQYSIGPAYNHDQLGPTTLRLDPQPGTGTGGRDAFRIHGNNSTNDASTGCVILDPVTRGQINSGSTLTVVSVLPGG
jgi:hypothetical protein